MEKNRVKFIGLAATLAVLAPLVYIAYRAERSDNTPAPTPSAVSPSATAAPENPEHEIAALKEQLGSKPGHIPILLRLAQLTRDKGDLTAATAYLRQAVEAEPDNAEARLELGRALFESGDTQQAITETELILKKEPNQVDALYNLGAIYGNLNDRAKAREYFSRAAAADPTSPSGENAKKALAQLEQPAIPR
jgi:Flp pilus assembly protein TadD